MNSYKGFRTGLYTIFKKTVENVAYTTDCDKIASILFRCNDNKYTFELTSS